MRGLICNWAVLSFLGSVGDLFGTGPHTRGWEGGHAPWVAFGALEVRL